MHIGLEIYKFTYVRAEQSYILGERRNKFEMMKLILAVVLAVAVATNASPVNMNFERSWQLFKIAHGKNFESVEEEYRRQQIFAENVKAIESHNYLYEMGLKTFKISINQFSDMTSEEMKQMNGFKMGGIQNGGSTFLPVEGFVAPKSVDWREKGYVTPVKDQGHCGSCWSFSATGAIEGQHFRKTNKLVSLSEQNLVDCDPQSHGCMGGLMTYAFEYVKNNKGIDTEHAYPYKAAVGECHFKKAAVGATVSGYVNLPRGNETALMEAVATIGPISIAIDASPFSFGHYKSGIYQDDDCSSVNLDHGVLLVGYGSENGQDYWIVKNSWGSGWGDKGYIRIARNMDNMCGIATMASYPLV